MKSLNLSLWMAIYNTANRNSHLRTTRYLESQAQPQVQHRECPKEARWWFHLGYWGRSGVPAHTASSSTASRLLTMTLSQFLLMSTAGRFVCVSAHSPKLSLNGEEGDMCRHHWFSLTALNPARSSEYLIQHLKENGASMRTMWLREDHGQQHGSNKRNRYQLFLSEHLPFIGEQSHDAERLSAPDSCTDQMSPQQQQ